MSSLRVVGMGQIVIALVLHITTCLGFVGMSSGKHILARQLYFTSCTAGSQRMPLKLKCCYMLLSA